MARPADVFISDWMLAEELCSLLEQGAGRKHCGLAAYSPASNLSLPLASSVASPLWALVSSQLRLDHLGVRLILRGPGKSRLGRAIAQGRFPEWAAAPKKCLLKAQ